MGSGCKLFHGVYCHIYIRCIFLHLSGILDNEKAPKAKSLEGNSGKEMK